MFGKKKKDELYDYAYEEIETLGDKKNSDAGSRMMHTKDELHDVKKELADTKSDYAQLISEVAQIREENQKLSFDKERIVQESRGKQEEVDQLTNKLIEIQKVVNDYRSSLAEFDRKKQEEISQAHELIASMEEENKRLQKKSVQMINEIEEERELIKQNKEKYSSILQEMNQLNKEKETLLVENQQLVDEKNSVVEKLKIVNQEKNNLSLRIEEYEKEHKESPDSDVAGKLEIANVLVDAKELAGQIVGRAEEEAQNIMNKVSYEADLKKSEAEMQLRLIREEAQDVYKNVISVKNDSVHVLETLEKRLAAFGKNSEVLPFNKGEEKYV